MNHFVVFALAVVSVKTNTLGRGWGSQPSISLLADANIQSASIANSTSYFTSEGTAAGDVSQPASVSVSTSESTGALGTSEIDQAEGVYIFTGESYLGNSAVGEDATYNLHNAVIHGSGTSVLAGNTGGGNSYGVGQISGGATSPSGVA